jgi:hypothetical protein
MANARRIDSLIERKGRGVSSPDCGGSWGFWSLCSLPLLCQRAGAGRLAYEIAVQSMRRRQRMGASRAPALRYLVADRSSVSFS